MQSRVSGQPFSAPSERSLFARESLVQDLKFGLRLLSKSPGFTLVAILTLALGIGVNTAVFSAVDSVLLQALPYLHPEQLLLVSEAVPQLGGDDVGVAQGEYLDYRDQNRSFVQTAAYQNDGFNLTGAGTPLRINATRATPSLFPLLGVRPILGRSFTEQESVTGADSVVVISHDLWQRQYGENPGVLGQTIKLDEKPYTIVGVMPASFRFPSDSSPATERVELWVPLSFSAELLRDRLREFGIRMIGRLKPGVTVAQAEQDVKRIAEDFMRQHGDVYSGTIRVVPHTMAYSAHSVAKTKPVLLLLMGAVVCVLLIACANVANLLLARASQRSREMAIRAAIGAARRRLVAQLLVESSLLSLAGGASGVLLAWILVIGLRHFGPSSLSRLEDVTFHPAALGFTLLVSMLTSFIFGFVPALRLSEVSPQFSMKETQAGPARATHSLQTRLVVAEMAAALVLLFGCSLLFKSFVRVLNVPFGFNPDSTMVVRTIFDRPRYPEAIKREAVEKELLERLSEVPGVTGVAVASHLPLSDQRQIGFRLENAAANDFHWAENSLVSPGYFKTMGISILRGRDIGYEDSRSTPLVAVVNATFARTFLAGGEVIGRRFNWGDRGLFSIVGVVNDVHISALDQDPPPMIYLSMFQVESGASSRAAFILRFSEAGSSASEGTFNAIRRQIWAVDKDLPTYDMTTLSALVSESVAQRRFTTLLMGGFAIIAVLLASIGLFGVISYLVSSRTRELAVRMALGAGRMTIYWMIVRRGAAMALVGCVAGLAAFAVASRLLRSSLYQVSAFDPAILSLAPLLLIGVALFACYWPARRAMKVEPISALRYE